MYFFAYHRTSTEEQNLDRGLNEINLFCRERNITLKKFYTDQRTGRDFDRPSYIAMKEALRPGDTLIITEIDRLGRNSAMTLAELRYFKDNNIRLVVLQLRILTQENLNTQYDNAARLYIDWINNAIIELFAIIAERDNENRKEAQLKGIEAAKAKGVYLGRKREMELLDFALHYREVLSGALKPFQCIKRCELKEPTYYRYVKEYKNFAKFVKLYSDVLAGRVPEIECENLFKDNNGKTDRLGYENAKKRLYEAKSRKLLADFLNYREELSEKSFLQDIPKGISEQQGTQTIAMPLSHHYSKLTYTDFHHRYANLIKGISANNNPTLKERAEIMGISIPEFEEHRKAFLNEEFIKSYQEVEQGIITAEDCMAKFGLNQEEYSNFLTEYEITYEPVKTYSSHTDSLAACSILPNQAQARPQTQPLLSTPSTEQAAQKSFIAAAFSAEPSQDNKEILNDESDTRMHTIDEATMVREYIDGLRGKMQRLIEAQFVIGLNEEIIEYLSQNSDNLASYYEFPLSEIQQSVSELERYVDDLIALLGSANV